MGDAQRGKWQVTIQELLDERGKPVFKVTRSIPELHVSETLFFRSKNEAHEKLNEWLR